MNEVINFQEDAGKQSQEAKMMKWKKEMKEKRDQKEEEDKKNKKKREEGHLLIYLLAVAITSCVIIPFFT